MKWRSLLFSILKSILAYIVLTLFLLAIGWFEREDWKAHIITMIVGALIAQGFDIYRNQKNKKSDKR